MFVFHLDQCSCYCYVFFSLVYFNLITSLFPSIFYNIISAFRKCFVNVICVSIWTKYRKIFSENIESKLNNG